MIYIGNEIRMREVNLMLPVFESGRGLLLDVGAGNGDYKQLCESHGFKYLGIDKVHENHEKMVFKKDVFGAIAFDCKFNCIILVDVLEHIENDDEILGVLHGLLDKDGFLLIHTPNKDGTHILCSPKDNEDHKRTGYSLDGLCNLLTKNNFKIVMEKSTFGFHDTLIWDLYYCIENDIQLSIAEIKELCINHNKFTPLGIIVLAKKIK